MARTQQLVAHAGGVGYDCHELDVAVGQLGKVEEEGRRARHVALRRRRGPRRHLYSEPENPKTLNTQKENTKPLKVNVYSSAPGRRCLAQVPGPMGAFAAASEDALLPRGVTQVSGCHDNSCRQRLQRGRARHLVGGRHARRVDADLGPRALAHCAAACTGDVTVSLQTDSRQAVYCRVACDAGDPARLRCTARSGASCAMAVRSTDQALPA